MFAALLAFLPAFKLPSIETCKIIVIGLLIVGGWGFGLIEYAEVEKLKGEHQEAVAKANAYQLTLQKHWDDIGAKDEADYLARLKLIEAETQRQSQALLRQRGVQHQPRHSRGSDRGAVVNRPDDSRIIGVLRDAYGTH